MLKEIRQQLLEDIKEELGIELVDRYRGEFEEGADWNPAPTVCFIRAVGYRKRIKAADGSGLRKTGVFMLYAGGNLRNGKDGLDVAESLINMLDGSVITVPALNSDKFRITVSEEGMGMILYDRGFEGYTFTITVT